MVETVYKTAAIPFPINSSRNGITSFRTSAFVGTGCNEPAIQAWFLEPSHVRVLLRPIESNETGSLASLHQSRANSVEALQCSPRQNQDKTRSDQWG